MFTTLRIEKDTLALEAFSVSDLQASLKRVFPGIASGVKGFLNHFTATEPAIGLTGKQNDFIRDVTKHNFLDIAPLSAFVPEGLGVKYLEYAAPLEQAALHASHIIDGVLAPYTVYLSQLITNQDQKLATVSHDNQHKETEKVRETINKALGACFKKGSSKTEVKLSDVISRNADWPEVFRTADALSTLINSVDRKVLNKKIAESAELLDKLIIGINKGEFAKVSPAVVKNLAEGAYQVARELEFFSVTYYKVKAYVETINRTTEHSKEVFKRK